MSEAKKRVLDTLQLIQTDPAPTAFHNSAVVAEISGLTYDQFFRNGLAMAEAHIKAFQRFGYEAIIVDSGTHCSAETLGCGAYYADKVYPVTTTPILKRLEDIRELKLADPNVTFPASEMIACIRMLRQHLGDEVAIIATGDQGPFTLAALLYGLDNWLLAVKTGQDIDLLHRILDFCAHYTSTYAIALHEAGADVVRFGDSFGGTQVISPAMYYEWTFPYEKKLINALKLENFPTSIHICGNATPILEGMIATGANMIEVDERTDFRKACETCTGRVALLGPVSPANMVFKSPAEVKLEAEQSLRIARQSGTALILGAGCSMAGDTPFKNIDAVIDAARTC